MPRQTGGEAVVQSLSSEGVKVIFGIPGTHGLALFDALHDNPGIRRIITRHEQGAAFMADGYARASGEAGVCLTATGPGVINSLSAMGTAFIDSSPVLNIFTQIPSIDIGKTKGYLHEVRDQLPLVADLTGWSARAESVSQIPWLVRDAMGHMRNGRTTPTAIEVPRDILDSSGDAPTLSPIPKVRDAGDPFQVSEAAKALLQAKRPFIWAGGGVVSSQASQELLELAELIEAPVFTTIMGIGSIPGNHPLHLGNRAINDSVQAYFDSCDMMLVVGSRFSHIETADLAMRFPKQIVRIDVDPAETGRNYPANINVVGDAKIVLTQILDTFTSEQKSLKRVSRAAEVAELKGRVRTGLVNRSQEAVALFDEVVSVMPDDSIIANDVTTFAYWAWSLLEVQEPRKYLYPWGFGTLGFGMPAALGAKVACPDKQVLAVAGDGGFMFTGTELATAVQFDINVVTLIVNDNCFGVLEPQQEARFGRTIMTKLKNPDFAAMARSFGAHGVCVDRIDKVGPALSEAFALNKPAVVELKIDIPDPFDW